MDKDKTAVEIKDSSYIIYSDGRIYNKKSSLFIKPYLLQGYLRVNLQLKEKRKTFSLHRLIAIYFIKNEFNKPCINHINGIKSDNRVENLEWCTHSENIKHAYKIGLCKMSERTRHKIIEANTGRVSTLRKKVINDTDGLVFDSVSIAAIHYGISRSYMTDMLIGRKTNKLKVKYYTTKFGKQ